MRGMFSLESCLKWSIAILLFLLPWQTIFITREVMLKGGKWQYGTLGWYGTEILLWCTVILFCVWYGKRVVGERKIHREPWRLTPDRQFVLACAVFAMYCLLTAFWAPDRSIAIQQSLRVLEAVLLFFVVLLGPLRLSYVLAAFVSGAVVQSVFGIVQFLFQRTWSSVWLGLSEYHAVVNGVSVVAGDEIGRWLRAYGSFPHPNMFGGYLVMTLIATSLLWYRYRREQKQWMVIVWFAAVLQLIALFLTFSRAAWIAIAVYAVGLFVYMWNEAGEKKHLTKIALSFVGVFLVLASIFFPLIKNRTTHTSSLEVRSTVERVSGYHEAWNLFQERPLFGVGVGNYTAALIEKDSSRPGWEYQPVHLVPLLLLVEIGLAGVLALLIVIINFYKLCCSVQKRNRLFVMLMIMPLFILALFDHFLVSSAAGVLLLGACFAISARQGISV